MQAVRWNLPEMSVDFHLGSWIVRPQRRVIERGDESVHVTPKAMAVLECLMAAAGEPVSRDDLFDTVWPGAEVYDDSLTKCIGELRRAFGDSAHDAQVIETIPKFGFRLLQPAEPLPEQAAGLEQVSESDRNANDNRPRYRRTALTLVSVVLVFAALLSYDASRLWLKEAGATLFLKAAAVVAPPRLERAFGIAVLPFVNRSRDAGNDYFSDGMTEEILNALANTNRLPVIARTSSFQFKGQNKNAQEIGRLLGVTHLLEGSVRKSGNNIRLTVQLVDTDSGACVWSEAYQRELSDVFALQAEVANNVVEQIGVALDDKLAPLPTALPTAQFMATHHTSNIEAYNLYLKGVELVTSTTPALIEQAAGYFDKAITLDSNYADAWAAKGWALYVLGRPSYGHPHIPAAVYPAAIAAYRRALEIEPRHAFAKGWLGAALIVNDYQWAEGMRLMQESLAQNPNDAELLAVYGMHLGWMQIEGADKILDRAYRLDPFGTLPLVIRANQLREDGRLLKAAALMELSLMADPDGYASNLRAAFFNIRLGRLDAAEAHLRKARQVAHPVDLTLDVFGWVIDSLRGKGPLPLAEIRQREKTERLSHMTRGAFTDALQLDEKGSVAAYRLAIKQRHPELRGILFGPRPPLIPEADWRGIKEITGVTRFQLTEKRRVIAGARKLMNLLQADG